MGENTTVRCLY